MQRTIYIRYEEKNMDNLQWLIENGGAAIKLRMIDEGLLDKKNYNVNELANELLQIEKVKTALTYFDPFAYNHPLNELWIMIHNYEEYRFENFIRFFIAYGFRKGISAFDDKIEYMRQTYVILMDALHGGERTVIKNLLQAGYYYDDMEKCAVTRLDKIHKITEMQAFDFYEEDITKIRNPNNPAWKDKLIVKDKYNPYEYNPDSGIGEFPLPLSHDIELLLSIYKYIKDGKIKNRIDDMIEYILDPRYQTANGREVWHWSPVKKVYHAGGEGLSLPIFDSIETGIENYNALHTIDMMSRSPVVLKSNWFEKVMNYLEKYRTGQGTYLFPESCMFNITFRPSNSTTLCSAFISKDILPNVKRNKRKSFAFELFSTFFMSMLKKRLKCS